MTEAEWMECTEPMRMLGYLSLCGYLNDRKLRLLGVACCRTVWFWLEEEHNILATTFLNFRGG